VSLPGRQIHAGVWFGLFRSMLDEVSLALTTRRGRRTLHSGAHLGGDWPSAARRPCRVAAYEQVAATAIQLAADGHITPRGTFGSALQPGPHLHVYDGDRPSPPYKSAWQKRAFLFGIGIPDEFLPTAREFGRDDLA
jgi:hypothetical protein